MTKTLTTGRSLTAKPVYNGTSLEGTTEITKAIVKNIRSRRSFTDGRAFVGAVVTSISEKFPQQSRGSVYQAVYRTLTKFF